MKTPDYLSYERYKKHKQKGSNKILFMFIFTFLITLLSFSVVVKFLTPDVDVSIGGETEVEPKDTGLGVKRFIDERLKLIQQEDNSVSGNSNLTVQKEESRSLDESNYEIKEENLVLPENHEKQKEESVMPSYEQVTAPPRPVSKPVKSSAQSQANMAPTPSSAVVHTPKISKVYVGKYSNPEQARVAQEILMDAGLGVTPFIKDLGGSYTLQLGSFSSRAKAEDLANLMKKNGFPARISVE